MKRVFVRFKEVYDDRVSGPSTIIASGDDAESHEAFINWHASGVQVEILNWFEVPEKWENLVAGGEVNATFEALLALDALGETPVVSDLLATIFEEGYRLAQKKERDLAATLRALLEN